MMNSWLCNQSGMRVHLKKDCQNNKKNTNKAPEAITSQGCVVSASGNGEILYNEAIIGSKCGKQLTDTLIMDTGATWHMTLRRDLCCTYEPVSKGSVFMGDDHILEIGDVEVVKIKIFDSSIHTI